MTLNDVHEVTRVVEIPVIEQVVRTVPRSETVEIEKRCDNVHTEYLDRVVEVDEVRRVQKRVEVPQPQEIIKMVTRKEVVPVPKEVIKYVTRAETRIVEEIKKVPGQRIEVPKIIDVKKEVIIPRYTDVAVPTVVAQTVIPIITDEGYEEQVEAITYEPIVVPVDVYVVKPIDRPVTCDGRLSEDIKEVDIPAPQFNSILRSLNAESIEENKTVYRDLPFRKEEDGTVHFLTHKDGSIKPYVLPNHFMPKCCTTPEPKKKASVQKTLTPAMMTVAPLIPAHKYTFIEEPPKNSTTTVYDTEQTYVVGSQEQKPPSCVAA